jgi:SNF family Na+-dependent transporter
VVIAIMAMASGLLLCHPALAVPDGATLVAWLVLVVAVAVPVVVFELGVGAIYQDSLAESCRKAGRRWEVVGWLAVAGALLGLLLLLVLGGRVAVHAYDAVLAALADQPTPWVAHAEEFVAPRASGELLAIALLLGVVLVRLWRGAPVIARTSAVLGGIGVVGLLVVAVVLLTLPGSLDGLHALLTPRDGWHALLGSGPWLSAAGLVLTGFALGTGAVTAYGSYLNRSTDAIGLGVVGVLGGAIAQALLLLVLAIGGGVIVLPMSPMAHGLPPALGAVAGALANSGLTWWWSAALQALWFITVLALLIPALLALSEAVVAPLVDKFRLPRERVVPSIALGGFFATAAIDLHAQASQWCFAALMWLIASTVIMQTLCALLAIRLEAVARHLNAYSAFRLGWSWRLGIGIAVPASGVLLLVGLVHEPSSNTLVGAGVALALGCGALLVSRLAGRGG